MSVPWKYNIYDPSRKRQAANRCLDPFSFRDTVTPPVGT